ncbi:unnamed protein product [Ectocarpus sp. 13 AM-2016]
MTGGCCRDMAQNDVTVPRARSPRLAFLRRRANLSENTSNRHATTFAVFPGPPAVIQAVVRPTQTRGSRHTPKNVTAAPPRRCRQPAYPRHLTRVYQNTRNGHNIYSHTHQLSRKPSFGGNEHVVPEIHPSSGHSTTSPVS